MSQLSKTALMLMGLASFAAYDGVLSGGAWAMQIPQKTGIRTFNNDVVGDVFTNSESNEKVMFVVTDGKVYSTYLTDMGEQLTIQEVPGSGRCGDYALGIDRKELLKRIKVALHEGNKDVEKYYQVWVGQPGNPYKSMSKEKVFEMLLAGDTFLDEDMLFLAAKLFKINIELYIPDTNTYGAPISVNNAYGTAQPFKTFNRLILSKSSMDFPAAPVMRIYHCGNEGYYDTFRRTNTKHYRYLYKADKMESWEKEKVRLLEQASAQYFQSSPDKKVGPTYEDTVKEIFLIQEKALTGNKPVQTNVSPSKNVSDAGEEKKRQQDEREQNETLAKHLKDYAKSGFSDDELSDLITQIDPSFDKQRRDTVIELIKTMNQGESQVQNPGLERTKKTRNTPVQNNVSPSRNVAQLAGNQDESAMNEVIARDLKDHAKTRYTDNQMSEIITRSYPGLDKSRIATIIELVKKMYPSESQVQISDGLLKKYAKELRITKEELMNNAKAVGMSPTEYYNMMK